MAPAAKSRPWFVLEITGTPATTGLITLFEMTPLVLSKIDSPGGTMQCWMKSIIGS